MALLSAQAKFVSDLVTLWEVTRPDSYKDTCDLIEDFWGNARVAGFEAAASPVFVPGITYAAMAPLGVPGGTAETAAAAIEAALTTMCISSILTVTPPAVATPPPIPLTALPGTLVLVLVPLFKIGVTGVNTAASVAAAIATFLGGWQLNVVIPPAASTPIPII